MQTIIYILPEIFLSLVLMTLLIIGVFIKKSFKLVNSLTILSLSFAIALVINQPKDGIKIFSNSYIIDEFSIFMKVLVLLFTLLILFASKEYLRINSIDKISKGKLNKFISDILG